MGWTHAVASRKRTTYQPDAPGRYERLSALGAHVDYWDGAAWRRIDARGKDGGGVICANQHLPWRVAAHQ